MELILVLVYLIMMVQLNCGVPVAFNVWGVFTSFKATGLITDSTGNHTLSDNYAMGGFFSILYPDTNSIVKINGYQLHSSAINNYIYFNNTQVGLDLSNNNNWIATGKKIPNVSYNYTGSFPLYTGTMPDTISTTNNLTITFDASNTSNADSAFIFINEYDYYHTRSFDVLSNKVSCNGGVATILSEQLTKFKSYNPATPVNPVYLRVILLRSTTNIFDYKQFAFIKCNEAIHNVVLN